MMSFEIPGKFLFHSMLAFGMSAFMISCGNQVSDDSKESADTTAVQDSGTTHPKKQSIVYSLPSPVQLGRLLQRAGASYDKSLLNIPENAGKYSTKGKKALNMGVYVADLSYSATFSKSQETIHYIKSTKKMADDLGVSASLSDDVIKRMETNSSSKDSLLPMISDILLSSTESFKESEQAGIAALAIAGGFVEGLFIGTQVTKTVKNNEMLLGRIAEMKTPLSHLILMLMNEAPGGEPELSTVLTELKAIKLIYDESSEQSSESTVKTDAAGKSGTIGGGPRYSLSPDQLERITAKVESLRNQIIKL